jgi:hypothetical protein
MTHSNQARRFASGTDFSSTQKTCAVFRRATQVNATRFLVRHGTISRIDAPSISLPPASRQVLYPVSTIIILA